MANRRGGSGGSDDVATHPNLSGCSLTTTNYELVENDMLSQPTKQPGRIASVLPAPDDDDVDDDAITISVRTDRVNVACVDDDDDDNDSYEAAEIISFVAVARRCFSVRFTSFRHAKQ